MELIIFIILIAVIASKNKKSKQGDYVDSYLEQNKKSQGYDWKNMIPEDQGEQLSKSIQEMSDAVSNMFGKLSGKKKHQTPEEYQTQDRRRRQMSKQERRQREYEEERKRRLEQEKKQEEQRRRQAEKEARLAEQNRRAREKDARQTKKEARLAEEKKRQLEREQEARFADCTVHSFHGETDPAAQESPKPVRAFCLEDYLFPTAAPFYPGNEKKEVDGGFKVEDYLFPTTAPFYPKADVADMK